MKTAMQRCKAFACPTLGVTMLIYYCLSNNLVFSGEGWFWVEPPADAGAVIKLLVVEPRGHNLSLVGLQGYAMKMSGLASPPTLSKWKQRRAFDSAEACENHKSVYRETLNLVDPPTEAEIEKSKLPVTKNTPDDVYESKVAVVTYLSDWLLTQKFAASRCVSASMLLQK